MKRIYYIELENGAQILCTSYERTKKEYDIVDWHRYSGYFNVSRKPTLQEAELIYSLIFNSTGHNAGPPAKVIELTNI